MLKSLNIIVICLKLYWQLNIWYATAVSLVYGSLKLFWVFLSSTAVHLVHVFMKLYSSVSVKYSCVSGLYFLWHCAWFFCTVFYPPLLLIAVWFHLFTLYRFPHSAYAVTQGVSESILGILMGVSAVFGILGTFAYPVLRRRVGLMRTGIFALSSQVACLTLCVVSIWMPGSPFDPLYLVRPHEPVDLCNYTTSVLPVIMVCGGEGRLTGIKSHGWWLFSVQVAN